MSAALPVAYLINLICKAAAVTGGSHFLNLFQNGTGWKGVLTLPDEQKEQNHNRYIYIAVIVMVLCAAAYFFLRSSGDNSGAADGVRSQIEQAGRNQQTITDGIADAEKGVGGITTSIDRSAEAIGRADSAAGRLESYIEEAGSLIADCREILGSIRENAGKKDAE